MALTPQNILNNGSSANLNSLAAGVTLTEVNGLGNVETYGRGIRWHHVEVLKDASIITEKRDRFEKRNALVNGIAEVGNFEYAIVVSPSVNGKRMAQCSFCNAHHNWVVLYRSTEGKHLGWSGTDCFAEIVKNLGLPAAQAMIEQVKSERSRSEKFRKTMEKVNDFKRDFPNVYENRETLGSYKNPYASMFWAVRNRLNGAEGVTEKWLADCENGIYDRTSVRYDWESHGRIVTLHQEARRIPNFLKWVSQNLSAGMPIGEVMRLLVEKNEAEKAEAQAKAKAAMAKPTPPITPPAPQVSTAPAPVVGPVKVDVDKTQTQAKELLATGRYGWSTLVKHAADGEVNIGMAKWVAAEHEGMVRLGLLKPAWQQ
jgi:hypothetical protein